MGTTSFVVLSIDTKKKELVGEFKNGGREWQPKGQPEAVNVHDFLSQGVGKAIPYGLYDVSRNRGAGWVWAPTTTPPASRWRHCVAGGWARAALPLRDRASCCSAPMVGAATTTAPVCGRPSSPEAEARKTGMERVVLTVEDDAGRRKVAFQARLVGTQFVQRGTVRGDWSVYLTGQGRLVAYEDEDQHLFVYDDFSELERVFKDEAAGLLGVVAEGLGQEYVQELDI